MQRTNEPVNTLPIAYHLRATHAHTPPNPPSLPPQRSLTPLHNRHYMVTPPSRVYAPPPGTMSSTEPVELNVYDLLHPDNPDAVPTINWYLYNMGMGLYHSGVSVYGKEYCYGGHPDSHTGVFAVPPKTAPDARFRQTITIGRTALSPHQVAELVDAMAHVWKGNLYNLLTRNCNHFASDLCERLTGAPAPDWVNRLAWMGDKARFLLPKGFDTPLAAPVTDPARDLHPTIDHRDRFRDPDLDR